MTPQSGPKSIGGIHPGGLVSTSTDARPRNHAIASSELVGEIGNRDPHYLINLELAIDPVEIVPQYAGTVCLRNRWW